MSGGHVGRERSDRGPTPWLPRWIAGIGAAVYGREITKRNRAYDGGEGVTTLDVPVLSVGNLSVGGTGKTPMVEHLVRTLAAAGRRPCIAMRGYLAKDGVSDEAEEYREALRAMASGEDVPVVAQPDRIAGIQTLIDQRRRDGAAPIDCVVLDDGFQHRKIAREFDLVLVDATRPFSDDALLPRGWLREGPASLARAHAVVVTRVDRVSDRGERVIADVRRHAPNALIGSCLYEWTAVEVTTPDGATRTEPVDWLRGKRAFGCCAIGNPDAFIAQSAEHAGDAPVATMILRDHDHYEAETRERIAAAARNAKADLILSTRKDWMKMRGANWPLAVARPVIGVKWASGGDEIERRAVGATSPRR